MVKLKVIARIIPEDAYLASVESSTAHGALIPGEKRFHVIVREPDTWFIGTLVNAIKQRYEKLYRYDLGQIKYLKDNEDDCDLDPELSVADAFVDEGKALSDPSDQHATIRVIQEQGRAIRQGSVIPDLSQVHYSLPERPVRPPVPRFEDVASALGKRKVDSNAPDEDIVSKRTRLDQTEDNVVPKRTRLDQIEEDDLVTSIEQQQSSDEHVVIENSQPTETTPSVTKPQQTKAFQSPELSWSFSQVGPPTIKQPSLQMQTEQDSQPVQPPQHQSYRTPEVSRRNGGTPNGARGMEIENSDGKQAKSPAAGSLSSSKKFVNPRRDLYAGPESDIDDSQMSPTSQGTSRITPRLVPSGKANSKQIETQDGEAKRLWQSTPKATDHVTNETKQLSEHTDSTGESQSDERDSIETSSTMSSKRNRARRRKLEKSPPKPEQLIVPSAVEGQVTPDVRTPSPDSPSEQLSQALQESARQGRDTDSASASSSTSATDSDETSTVSHIDSPTKSAKVHNDDEKQTTASATDPTPPAREQSIVSQATSASRIIIPPGMTQEQYERAVRGNAHLNTLSPLERAKKRSTPSLRKTPSMESSSVKKIETTLTRPKTGPKPSATPTPKPAQANRIVSQVPLVSATRSDTPKAFTSARSLKELKVMANSVENSAAGSPVPKSSQLGSSKTYLEQLDSDSDDDDDDSDDSDSSSHVGQSAVAGRRTPAAAAARPDPTIRDVSDDDD